MDIFSQPSTLQQTILAEKKAGKTVAFVPTMGNLHDGHLQLIKQAKKTADCVIASIFVNSMQFGPNEDFDNYPRTLEEDKKKLDTLDVNYLFTPTSKIIYPDGSTRHTHIHVPKLGDYLCGQSRSGHFDGVTSIVNKLFNIVQPDFALFGEKDLQQLIIIEKMVKDLCLPIQIISVATERDTDGLALSSRNQYLSNEERQIAPLLYQTLQQIKNQILACQKSPDDIPGYFKHLELEAINKLNQSGFKVDYLVICNTNSFASATEKDSDIALFVAAYLGDTRLIDNIKITLNSMNV